MGLRLSSETPITRRSQDVMISDATFPGALQVPSSGQPILLLADRPTTGGYPQIAVVISADLGLAGQLLPGDRENRRAAEGARHVHRSAPFTGARAASPSGVP